MCGVHREVSQNLCSLEQLSIDRANMQLAQSYLLQLSLGLLQLPAAQGHCWHRTVSQTQVKIKQKTKHLYLLGSSSVFCQPVPI